jgi:hypothetical protein
VQQPIEVLCEASLLSAHSSRYTDAHPAPRSYCSSMEGSSSSRNCSSIGGSSSMEDSSPIGGNSSSGSRSFQSGGRMASSRSIQNPTSRSCLCLRRSVSIDLRASKPSLRHITAPTVRDRLPRGGSAALGGRAIPTRWSGTDPKRASAFLRRGRGRSWG